MGIDKGAEDDSSPFETVTKLQVAERQLRVAIRLFFERRDGIAVHTLGTAALGILRDLGRRRGIKSIREMDFIRPERKQELDSLLNKAQNFFKHADKDPDSKLKFYYEATPFYLLDAVQLFGQPTGRQSPEGVELLAWSLVKFPDIVVPGSLLGQQVAKSLVLPVKPG
jgi:hypothetical protein